MFVFVILDTLPSGVYQAGGPLSPVWLPGPRLPLNLLPRRVLLRLLRPGPAHRACRARSRLRRSSCEIPHPRSPGPGNPAPRNPGSRPLPRVRHHGSVLGARPVRPEALPRGPLGIPRRLDLYPRPRLRKPKPKPAGKPRLLLLLLPRPGARKPAAAALGEWKRTMGCEKYEDERMGYVVARG